MADTPKTVDRYALNTFYNFAEYESGVFNVGEEQTVLAGDNPPFIYPSKYLKNSATGTSVKLQRGYIRMVLPKNDLITDNSLERKRLHFQFNPDSITRSVTARNDIQMWMNQSPEQLTQPIPGDSNFGFRLLFNREPDVYSGTYSFDNSTSSKIVVDAGQGSQELDISTNKASDNYINYTSATDIGVLADVMVFDSIIGQGINSDLVNYLNTRAERYRKYSQAQYDLTYADSEEAPPRPQDFDTDQASNILNANFGNAAFLISNPVRVVFSSLFMVEGYITNTQVVFNKFSPSMVPVQCFIDVTMQALYIGHARKDTFLTKSFEIADQVVDEAIGLQEQQAQAAKELGKNLFQWVKEGRDTDISPGAKNTNKPIGLSSFGFGTYGFDDDTGDDFAEFIYLRTKATQELDDNISNGTITDITANARLIIEYLGRALPKGAFYKPDPYQNLGVIVDAQTTSGFNKGDLTDSNGDTRTLKLQTTRLVNALTIPDEDNDAKYKITFTCDFEVSSDIAGSIIAEQQAYGEWTLNYTEQRDLKPWGGDYPPITLRQRPAED
jgi:hypothetical protein